MEIVLLVVLMVAAVVVLGLTLRVFVTAVKASRRGEIPTDEQRRQITVLGGVGLALALVAMLVPTFF